MISYGKELRALAEVDDSSGDGSEASGPNGPRNAVWDLPLLLPLPRRVPK